MNLFLVVYSLLELAASGGWSSSGLPVESPQTTLTVKQQGSYAYGAHVAYGLQFHRNVGLLLGVDFTRYGGQTKMEGVLTWPGVYDTDGERYDHQAEVHALSDRQEMLYLNIPLALRLVKPMRPVSLELQLGVKFGVPLSGKASYTADIEHVGRYGQWGELTLRNVPNHGFYRTPDFAGTYALRPNFEVFAFAKGGISVRLTEHLRLTTMVGFDYGLLSAIAYPDRHALGFFNDRPGQEQTHPFMAPYEGVTASEVVRKDAHPLSLTAELGLRVLIPHRVHEPCLCEVDEL